MADDLAAIDSRLAAIDLKAGDLLVMKVPHSVSVETRRRIQDWIMPVLERRGLTSLDFLIMDLSIELAVVRKDEREEAA